jgi:cell wall-associated NlpC family hydrolase
VVCQRNVARNDLRVPYWLGGASPTGSASDSNVVLGVYRMLGCSGLFPDLYQGRCKHQVPENAANSADLG